MTVKMYAERKKWPLKEVYVYLSHSKRHLDHCKEAADKTAKIDHIVKKLELVGDLSAEQKAKLKEIADRCPVHKTLTSSTTIETC